MPQQKTPEASPITPGLRSNNATGTFAPMGNATITGSFSTPNFTTSNATTTGTLCLKLTPTGATSVSGANLIDNIQIQSN
jgi:hypothetical protein